MPLVCLYDVVQERLLLSATLTEGERPSETQLATGLRVVKPQGHQGVLGVDFEIGSQCVAKVFLKTYLARVSRFGTYSNVGIQACATSLVTELLMLYISQLMKYLGGPPWSPLLLWGQLLPPPGSRRHLLIRKMWSIIEFNEKNY